MDWSRKPLPKQCSIPANLVEIDWTGVMINGYEGIYVTSNNDKKECFNMDMYDNFSKPSPTYQMENGDRVKASTLKFFTESPIINNTSNIPILLAKDTLEEYEYKRLLKSSPNSAKNYTPRDEYEQYQTIRYYNKKKGGKRTKTRYTKKRSTRKHASRKSK